MSNDRKLNRYLDFVDRGDRSADRAAEKNRYAGHNNVPLYRAPGIGRARRREGTRRRAARVELVRSIRSTEEQLGVVDPTIVPPDFALPPELTDPLAISKATGPFTGFIDRLIDAQGRQYLLRTFTAFLLERYDLQRRRGAYYLLPSQLADLLGVTTAEARAFAAWLRLSPVISGPENHSALLGWTARSVATEMRRCYLAGTIYAWPAIARRVQAACVAHQQSLMEAFGRSLAAARLRVAAAGREVPQPAPATPVPDTPATSAATVDDAIERAVVSSSAPISAITARDPDAPATLLVAAEDGERK